jgi:hypothetical protein
MALLNINVAQKTECSITVVFRGEGNDLVTVRMSANPDLSEEEVVQCALKKLGELLQFSEQPQPLRS